MMRKLYEKTFRRDLDLRERLFHMMAIVSNMIAVVSMVVCVTVMDIRKMIVPILILSAIVGGAIYFISKHQDMEDAPVTMGLVYVLVAFPAMFFINGGIDGGADVWFVLELAYVFMMFTGKRLAFFLLLAFAADIGTYILGYYHPEWVVQAVSKESAYLSSMLFVLIVGVASGLMIRFQMELFQIERAVSLRQKEELEKESNSKNLFFAKMSHEIRTPINTIVGLNELIIRDSQAENVKGYATNIKSASKMLLSLVNDILDLARIENKRMEIVPVEYKTRKLFEELVDMMSINMAQKKLEFIVDIDENIPSVLYGDKKRIQQVLLNILSNAMKYTQEGSVTFTAQAQHTSEENIRLLVSVADTGVGIRSEDLPYLYDAFQRGDERGNLRIEGSGLGLSITKQLVSLMGGEITVDSIYTKGSIFTVTLEQKVLDEKPIGNVNFLDQRAEKAVYQCLFRAPEAKILIVDDNEINASVTRELLRDTQVQTDIAHSGMECLEKTKQGFYNVILLDYRMPGMDGVETLKRLRKQENSPCRESAVLLLSANDLAETQKICEENRFDGYIEKPIVSKHLEEEIRKVLPEDILEYQRERQNKTAQSAERKRISSRRRKYIYVTTDCVCDLPEELLEKYDIQMMYLYIKTEHARFADTREISSDNLLQYQTSAGSVAYADSASVEEYEAFFAETLTKAEYIIHISMASDSGKSYSTAMAASAGFEHVYVIDSGQISGGEGLVTLYAARLAETGMSVYDICESVEKLKHSIQTKYVMPNAQIFYQHGYTSQWMARALDLFHLHPVLGMKRNEIRIVGAYEGNLENAWKKFIHSHLRRMRRIEPDIVIITHVSCTVKQLEMIKEEVLKCVPFKRVIIQKASLSNACNAGVHTIGIAYYVKQ